MEWIIRIFLVIASVSAVYVFPGNPYGAGRFDIVETLVRKDVEHAPPFAAMVYSPRQSGVYAAVLFAGGLYSYMPIAAYGDILSSIASHGFVVVGVELLQFPNESVPLLQRSRKPISNMEDPQKFFQELDWMKENLNGKYLSQYNVTVDWDQVGFSCHSDGCDYGIRMVLANSSRANFKGAVFYSPFSFHILQIRNGTKWPSLSFGTQLGEEWPPCCSPPFDFRGIYDRLACPRILANVTGFGHCDLLNDKFWTLCNTIHLCKTDPRNDRVAYKKFTQGIGTALFIATLQGETSCLAYATNKTLIPLPLGDLDSDVSCLH
ncbi:uncharacterized protein LOC134181349 isoform X2 [Corticium candelabrum]|uniref:uncharacterized protein LOC134181349 isoform X2 n=1 Tax=Corticium candelabrum TaxID=121492 RepID=UPI002E2601C1|nr:uncharacterized protein LOC134181349 isoform X2 [Corticium candelabrum]